MEAHTVNTLTHKSGDCKPKMFNKYMPSEFSDAFSELFIDGIWPLPDGTGMLHSRPEHREKPSRKGKKPCLPDSAPKKKRELGYIQYTPAFRNRFGTQTWGSEPR